VSLPVRLAPLPSIIAKNASNRAIGFHTNTERGYLSKGMQPRLQEVLADEWLRVAEAEREGKDGFEVVVSTADKDPYEIV